MPCWGESPGILPSRHGRQAVWCLITPLPTNPTVSSASLFLLSSLPPPSSSSSSFFSVAETDFPEGRRGRLRWWICSAEACLSNSWRAPGVVRGHRQGRPPLWAVFVSKLLNLCVVSLLSFFFFLNTQQCHTHGGLFRSFAFSSFFPWTNPLMLL